MDAYSYDPRRDRRGNMEGIPGFNLTYNDSPAQSAQLETRMLKSIPKAPSAPQPPPYFQSVADRVTKRQTGGLHHETVIRNAKARADHKALRASDGAPLRLPYKVSLKSAKAAPLVM